MYTEKEFWSKEFLSVILFPKACNYWILRNNLSSIAKHNNHYYMKLFKVQSWRQGQGPHFRIGDEAKIRENIEKNISQCVRYVIHLPRKSNLGWLPQSLPCKVKYLIYLKIHSTNEPSLSSRKVLIPSF